MARCGSVSVLADDLTGAVETAAAFLPVAANVRVALSSTSSLEDWPRLSESGVLALDLDLRHCAPVEAYNAMTRHLQRSAQVPTFVKVDSLLRGNVRAILTALTDAGVRVVFAPTSPALGRTVSNGRPLARGLPLAALESWSFESSRPPESVFDLLPERSVHLSLTTVRSSSFVQVVSNVAPHALVSCDAESHDDLGAIIAAGTAVRDACLVGSGALANCLVKSYADGASSCEEGRRPGGELQADDLLVVNGSRESSAARQVEALGARGVPHVRINAPGTPIDSLVAPVLAGLASSGTVALSLAGPFSASDTPSTLLAQVVVEILRMNDRVSLISIGGRTTRAILDLLGVRSLSVRRSLGSGAVECRAEPDRRVIMRPGSFGGPDHLVTLFECLRARITDGVPTNDGH